MYYLVLMAAAGAGMLALYCLWFRIFKGVVSYSMNRLALIIVLMAHLVPLTGLRVLYGRIWGLVFPGKALISGDIILKSAVIDASSGDYITPYLLIVSISGIVWVGVTAYTFIRKCVKYCQVVRQLRKLLKTCQWDEAEEKLSEMRGKVHLPHRIRVAWIEDERGSCTIGVFRPVILLSRDMGEREMELALRHELMHINRGDVAWKLLWELTGCVFWFNRFLQKFAARFNLSCEISCDERLVRNYTEEETGAYARLLSESYEKRIKRQGREALPGEKKILTERINAIMNVKRKKFWKKVIAVSMLAVFMLVDSVVALAYPDVYHVEDQVGAATEVAAGRSLWAADESALMEEHQALEMMHEAEFVDEFGRVTQVSTVQPCVFCPGHTWLQGYLKTHTKDGNGGCRVKVYNSKRCPWCNTIIVESLFAIYTYVSCPHTNPEWQ